MKLTKLTENIDMNEDYITTKELKYLIT